MSPSPSITTTWSSSFLAPLAAAKSVVVGLSTIEFHLTEDIVDAVPGTPDEV